MKTHSNSKTLISSILLTAFLLTNGLHAWTWSGETGDLNDVVLGALEDPSVVQLNESGYIETDVDDVDLDTWPYDIYIPEGYDATKPFGLITYISAGDNGVPAGGYKEALNDKNIIWIGGNNIGNWTYSRIRAGVAALAIYRAMEVFNIDPDRVYACGSSGGTRVATARLYWTNPQLIKGMIANVGCAFPQDLPDLYGSGISDYEHDAYKLVDDAYINNILSYDRPIAALTGYTDHRQGMIQRCYHLGLKPFGFDAKLITYDKGHSLADGKQFYDAVSFVDHPRFMRVDDTFSNNTVNTNSDDGAGFYNLSQTGATVAESGGLLKLTPTANTVASVASKTPFQWYDGDGAIVDFSFKTVPTAGVYNQRTSFGIWLEQAETFSTYRQPNNAQPSSLTSPANTAALLFTIEQTAGSSKLIMEINDTASDLNEQNYEKVFEVDFSSAGDGTDYPGWVDNAAEVDVRLHLMDTELYLEFTRHFDPTTFVSASGAVLMSDNLIVRVPMSDFPAGKKWKTGDDPADAATNSWPTSKRCLFTIATEALDENGSTPGRLEVSSLKIRDAGVALATIYFNTYTAPDLDNSIEYSSGVVFAESLADDGSIMNELTLELIGDTFTGADGSSFLSSGKATVTGLPTGLTADLVKVSDTELTMILSGNAVVHGGMDRISDISLSLANSAFSAGNASAITNSVRDDIGVQFLGDVVLVTSNADSGPNTLRDMVSQATGTTPIQFDASVTSITLTSGEILIEESITIDGEGIVTIDGNNDSRIFKINGSGLRDVSLIGLTLQNAENITNSDGGAIHSTENLTIENCAFNNNSVIYDDDYSFGGAIHSEGGNLTLINSTFTGNQATHNSGASISKGGAIYHLGNTLTVTDCIFDSNVAKGIQYNRHNRYGQGGAFFIASECVATMTRTQLINNQAVSYGGKNGSAHGGAVTLESSILSMLDCTLDNNLTKSLNAYGGAIHCWSGNQTTSVTLERCTLSNNTATAETNGSYGGAIAVDESSDNLATVTLKNCTLSGNLVNSTNNNDALGGAIYQSRSITDSDIGMTNILIYNSTVTGNQSTSSDVTRGKGGAFYLNRGQMTLHSSIVANNTASDAGQDIYLDATQFSSLTADYSMIKSVSDNHGLIDGVSNNIVGVDPALAALADNGGLTQTHALLSGSPAIDAGANAQALVYDQRGSGFDRLLNSQTDIGAFELLAAQGGFTVWAVDSGLTGEDAASDADPDGDGELNLLEYFVGSDPSSAGSVQINATIESGDKLAISYQSDNAVEPTDVTVIIQGSTDLGITDPWAPIAATHSVSGTGPYTHTWTQNQAIGAEKKAFIRITLTD